MSSLHVPARSALAVLLFGSAFLSGCGRSDAGADQAAQAAPPPAVTVVTLKA